MILYFLNKLKVSPRDNRRKVIKVGKFTVRTLVEVYPVDIKILTYFDSSDHHENGGKYTFKHFTRYHIMRNEFLMSTKLFSGRKVRLKWSEIF